jgi:hypothetical protein
LRATGVGTRSWLRDGEPDPSAAVTVTMGRHRSLDVFGLGAPLSGEDCRVIGRAFGHLIDRLKDRYDVVIVDSAPVLPVADTLALAPQTSAVINVVSLKEATRHSLRDTLAVLDLVGANVVGVVATHAPHKHPRGSGSYGYGYGYGDETSDAIATPATGGTDRTIDRSRVKNGQASLKEPHGPRERAHARRSEPKHDESVDDLLLIDDSMVPTDWRGQGPSAPQANLGADRSEPNRQLASRDHR